MPADDGSYYRTVLARLDGYFEASPPAEPTLLSQARDPLEALLLTLLSQATTDKQAAQVFASLREAYPRWSDLYRVPEPELQGLLRPAGLERQRSGYLRGILARLQSEPAFWDQVREASAPAAQKLLEELPGVEPKTAAVVLLFAFGQPVFPVDTHIRRVLERLGRIPLGQDAAQAQRHLAGLVPADAARGLHLQLIRLGREVCRSRKPRCPVCPLRDHCPYPERSTW